MLATAILPPPAPSSAAAGSAPIVGSRPARPQSATTRTSPSSPAPASRSRRRAKSSLAPISPPSKGCCRTPPRRTETEFLSRFHLAPTDLVGLRRRFFLGVPRGDLGEIAGLDGIS